MPIGSAAALALLLSLAAAPAAAAEKTQRKPPPWEKPLRAGLSLFRANCAVCHEVHKAESDKFGPPLFRFFQNELTPLTKIEVSEAYFRVKIQVGGAVMPAFQNKLRERELDLLVAYVRSKDGK